MTWTPREVAADIWTVARSMGRGRVVGADMTEINAYRRALLDRAIAAVDKAHTTERQFLAEPTDAQLKEMREWLVSRHEKIASSQR